MILNIYYYVKNCECVSWVDIGRKEEKNNILGYCFVFKIFLI